MRRPDGAPGARMSDAQYEAVLIELQRLIVLGAWPVWNEARHAGHRPELSTFTDRERLGFEVAQRRAARVPGRAERVMKMNARRDMRPSAS